MQTELAGALPVPPEGHEWWVIREPSARVLPILRVQLRDNRYGEQRIVDYALADLTFVHNEERAVAVVVEAAERVMEAVTDTSKQDAMVGDLVGVYGRQE